MIFHSFIVEGEEEDTEARELSHADPSTGKLLVEVCPEDGPAKANL